MPYTCKDCKKEIPELEGFPGPRCLACHSKIWDRVPVSQLPRPDFVGALNMGRKRKQS